MDEDDLIVAESVEGRQHHVDSRTQGSAGNLFTQKSEPGHHPANPGGSVITTREEARGRNSVSGYDDRKKVLWVRLGKNVYGGFIYHAFMEGFLGWNGALLQYGPMVAAVFLCQTSISFELHNSLPDEFLETLCDQPSNLQMAATFVFLLVTLENVPNIVSAALVCFTCEEFESELKQEQAASLAEALPSGEGSFITSRSESKRLRETWTRMLWRFSLFLCAVATEIVAWFSVLAVGLIWLFSAESSEEIVRTTVSISFVNNVDEMVYRLCVGPDFRAVHKAHRYKLMFRSSYMPFYRLVFWPRGRIYILCSLAALISYGVRQGQMSCIEF